jgi:hypothetical protein
MYVVDAIVALICIGLFVRFLNNYKKRKAGKLY